MPRRAFMWLMSSSMESLSPRTPKPGLQRLGFGCMSLVALKLEIGRDASV